MTISPLAHFLQEVGPHSSPADWQPFTTAPTPPLEDAPVSAAHEFELQEAIERTRAEVRAEAEAEIAAITQAHDQELAEKLEEQRTQILTEQSNRIAKLLELRWLEMQRSVSDAMVRVVRPVLENMLRDKAIEELADALRNIMSDGDAMEISISGPPDLVGRVRALIEEKSIPLTVAEVPEIDVRVRVDQTVIETNLGEWLAALGRGLP